MKSIFSSKAKIILAAGRDFIALCVPAALTTPVSALMVSQSTLQRIGIVTPVVSSGLWCLLDRSILQAMLELEPVIMRGSIILIQNGSHGPALMVDEIR